MLDEDEDELDEEEDEETLGKVNKNLKQAQQNALKNTMLTKGGESDEDEEDEEEDEDEEEESDEDLKKLAQ